MLAAYYGQLIEMFPSLFLHHWFPFAEEEKQQYFDYNGFFDKQLKKKKDEHSYRVFKKVRRDATSFPLASEESKGKRDITVWCSNDYMGMSWHPQVKQAVR